jgi:hypothetical protein
MLDHPLETRNDGAGAGERPIVTTPKRARAGRLGIPVLYVLIAGTALAVVALVIIFFVFHHAAPPPASIR